MLKRNSDVNKNTTFNLIYIDRLIFFILFIEVFQKILIIILVSIIEKMISLYKKKRENAFVKKIEKMLTSAFKPLIKK